MWFVPSQPIRERIIFILISEGRTKLNSNAVHPNPRQKLFSSLCMSEASCALQLQKENGEKHKQILERTILRRVSSANRVNTRQCFSYNQQREILDLISRILTKKKTLEERFYAQLPHRCILVLIEEPQPQKISKSCLNIY